MSYHILGSALSVLLFFTVLPCSSQPIRINEMVSSNDTYLDEDGDTPDWFELRNTSTEEVDLNAWTITDDPDQPDRWSFPSFTLPVDGYLRIWASGKDRSTFSLARTIISPEDQFRYIVPTAAVDPNWRTPGFDDSDWESGSAGFGYGDGDDATIIPNGSAAVFLRKSFSFEDINTVETLLLDIDYDDGFVAFLNGIEIARANINGDFPAFNALTITDREAEIYQGGLPIKFEVSDLENLLQPGENILSIQVHNATAFSSDLSLIPWLTAIFNTSTTEGTPPPAWMDIPMSSFHTNFKISAAGETLYLFNQQGVFVDSLNGGVFPSDVSKGRLVDQLNELRIFQTTTPGAANSSSGFLGALSSNVIFSTLGGTTPAPFFLTLSGAGPQEEIRYTLDASSPTPNSSLYTSPLSIANNTVVRAAIFREEYIPSTVQTETYLIGVEHDLPIISLVTDPDNFFDNETGIYAYGDDYSPNLPYYGANFWEDWERPIHFSFYETDGQLGISFNAGTKIFGGWSRSNDQRSLSIFARNQYGTGEIDYPLFPNLPYDEFESIVLRNSGNEWLGTNFRDAALTGLLRDADLETQAYRPCATYLNGEYWGMYNLREKINEHFVASKHQVDPNEIDLLEFDGGIVEGSNTDYLNLIAFVNNNDLSNDNLFAQVEEEVDIENYILYQLSQIYFDNTDWPGNNIKYWRSPNSKWRWILYDTDFGFGTWNYFSYLNNTLAFALDSDGPSWPNPPWSTALFRNLLENTGFKHRFINRFADEMNTRFLPSRVVEHIDTLQAAISNEIPLHFQRWGGDIDAWQGNVNTMKNFAQDRPAFMKQHILGEFNLPAYHSVTLINQTPQNGWVQLNSLEIQEENWSGDYFQNVPITLTAIAEPGYSFVRWTGDVMSTNPQLVLNITNPTQVEAVFVEDVSAVSAVRGIKAFSYYPNPSKEALNINFELARRQSLRVALYDQEGRLVKLLFNGQMNAGQQRLRYTLPLLPSGSYYLEVCNEEKECLSQQWIKIQQY
ncbi:MAG: CotH kinase family protein [Lewinella sp.]|uniref:CotH kinase family protein n=1 Tax=Lewinella sp. TaxID=2004506 RepID=UPI003D6B6817